MAKVRLELWEASPLQESSVCKKGVAIAQEKTDLGNPGEEERVTVPELQLTESPRPWEVGVRAGNLFCSHKPRHRDPRRHQMGQRVEWVVGRVLWQTTGWPPAQLPFLQDGAAILSGCEWLIGSRRSPLSEPTNEMSWKTWWSGLLEGFSEPPPDFLSQKPWVWVWSLFATWWRQCWVHDAKSRKQLASANSKGIPKGHTKKLKLQNE